MKLRTIIVEDEQPSRDRLKTLLAAFPEIDLIGEAGDGQEAVAVIDQLKPDLAFLDIQLPVFTSFEVLARIRHRPSVIFVTAYDQYAIKAFDENAVDYLLKPTKPERLQKAIQRVTEAAQKVDDRLVQVLKAALTHKQHPDRFTVKLGEEIIFVSAAEVYWFHASDKYVFLHTHDREYIIDLTLKKLEDELDPQVFLRIHKSVIVALDKIARVRRGFPGRFKVQMTDARKSSFEIGRTYLAQVRAKLGF